MNIYKWIYIVNNRIKFGGIVRYIKIAYILSLYKREAPEEKKLKSLQKIGKTL